MKNAKIVLVAEWDGWCGVCAADRPLVLTRTGRQRLRTWLTGAADDSRPLTLTCRLCGNGVDVPLEQDDPPVVETVELRPASVSEADRDPIVEPSMPTEAPVTQPAAAPLPVLTSELAAGRTAVAQVLRALAAQRSAPAAPTSPAPGEVPPAAHAVPLQRSAPSGGLAELQLLADGIDLLTTGRS